MWALGLLADEDLGCRVSELSSGNEGLGAKGSDLICTENVLGLNKDFEEVASIKKSSLVTRTS